MFSCVVFDILEDIIKVVSNYSLIKIG